jgi:putative endopeptidase
LKIAHRLAASAAALALAASFAAAAPPPAPAAAAPGYGRWGIDLTTRDPSVRPGDSFFDYANGAWLKTAAIRADRPAAGVGMDLQDRSQAQLRSIVEESVRHPRGATGRKVGGLYASFMDEARIERLDAAPLEADLDKVRTVSTKADMARLMGEGHLGFGSSIFSLGAIPDLKGAKVYTPTLAISGLSLPDRDFYLTEPFKAKKAAYRAYIARTLQAIGWRDAEASADSVLDFETKIASAMWTRTERRDPNKAYHPMSVAELQAMAPGFDFKTMFAAAGAPAFDRIIVGQDTAVPKVAKLFAETPLDTLKAWEAYHIANSASPYLSKRFVDSQFALIQALSGQPRNLTRWERGIALVDSTLGEALGQEYVARYFPASSKKMMEALVANLQAAMRERIRNAAWMTPQTRAAALAKQSLQRVKVGYPNKWRDYSALAVDPADLYGNVERAKAFDHRFDMNRLGKPVDRDEWQLSPQTVNAYNNPLGNEIVFPAAMLQAPMFDPKADPAVNYGAIGAVIGHEISHGFDDQGRQFDQSGTLRDWWQPADSARFTSQAGKLAAQYDAYDGAPGMKVNGKLTLGENIGDQGGILLALDAYHASLRGRPAPVLDGLTGDQRFFLAWAQGWRGKYRDDIAKLILVSDVHSPGRWRVDGTLRNIDQWYSAFDVRPGDDLYLAPEARVRVW